MAVRKVEDRLREEYFDLAPQIQLAAENLETRVRYLLLPLSGQLRHGERIVVEARSKECASAIAKLRSKQEGSVFDPEYKGYSLTALQDLAAVRVLAFPRQHIGKIDAILRAEFSDWKADPFREGSRLGYKYFGKCTLSDRVQAEYQIVPMLIGLFWKVEHAALYKTPELNGTRGREPQMKKELDAVITALFKFENEWSRLKSESDTEPEE